MTMLSAVPLLLQLTQQTYAPVPIADLKDAPALRPPAGYRLV